MKLPEHYEQWVQTSFSSTAFGESCKSGARAMYRKLMEDFAPAIEALKEIYSDTSEMIEMNSDNDAAYSFIRDRAEEALATLKEKGLVE